METKSADVSAGFGTVSSGSVASFVSNSTWRLEFMSITVIRLNGCNYAPWAKFVEVYMMAHGWIHMTNALPDRKDPSYATWKVEDARIRLCMWNSLEPQISSSIVYLITAK